ncbi:MAG: hypothetical protein OHK0012_17120 [Synechococcales cyanobacterium]
MTVKLGMESHVYNLGRNSRETTVSQLTLISPAQPYGKGGCHPDQNGCESIREHVICDPSVGIDGRDPC